MWPLHQWSNSVAGAMPCKGFVIVFTVVGRVVNLSLWWGNTGTGFFLCLLMLNQFVILTQHFSDQRQNVRKHKQANRIFLFFFSRAVSRDLFGDRGLMSVLQSKMITVLKHLIPKQWVETAQKHILCIIVQTLDVSVSYTVSDSMQSMSRLGWGSNSVAKVFSWRSGLTWLSEFLRIFKFVILKICWYNSCML